MSKQITIIVPVYADWDSLGQCIMALIDCVDPRHKILLVNDAGPEANYLEEKIKGMIHNFDHIHYHRNPENMGFLKNCNNAVFNIDKTNNDILLLNSDAVVTEGFLDSLEKVLVSDDRIATVSPRSNNATITTVPIKSAIQKGIEPKKSYALFQKMKNRLPLYNLTPVTHGFCMLIRREVINKQGLFDEVFGKGYGEEVDFCMRVGKAGYKHAICNRAYVYHMEARSFTLETKKKLISINEKVVDKRYPEYRRLVRKYRVDAERQEAAILDSKISRHAKQLAHKSKVLLKKSPAIRRVGRKVKSLRKR